MRLSLSRYTWDLHVSDWSGYTFLCCKSMSNGCQMWFYTYNLKLDYTSLSLFFLGATEIGIRLYNFMLQWKINFFSKRPKFKSWLVPYLYSSMAIVILVTSQIKIGLAQNHFLRCQNLAQNHFLVLK